MNYRLLVLCCFLSFYGHSQNIYTSSFTQTWPTIFNSEVEAVKKTVSFEENTIQLATETKAGKEIEIFYIRKIDEKENAIVYSCLTSHKQYITIVKPARMNPAFIDIFRASEKTGEEIQLRLHLD